MKYYLDNVIIRRATASESDIKGIVGVYKPDAGPWSKLDTCKELVTKRLNRGFYIQVAEADGKIVGYSEWVITDEPGRKFLYLSWLIINDNHQRKGIGRAMIADAIEHAKENNCSTLITCPDTSGSAAVFYRKCGFVDGRKQYGLKISTEKYKDYKFEKTEIDKVPFWAIKEKKFIFGKDVEDSSFSSRQMWEEMNEPPFVDANRGNPAILLSDGTYIQLNMYGEVGVGVCIWTNSTNYRDMIKSALSFGHSLGLHHLDFGYFKDEESFFDGFEVYDKKQGSEFEQIYCI